MAVNVQAAGGIGMIVLPPGTDGILMGLSGVSDEAGDAEAATIVIPVVTVEATLGGALREVAEAEEKIRLSRGTFDSTVVAHELG